MNKKSACFLLSSVCAVMLFAGCSSSENNPSATATSQTSAPVQTTAATTAPKTATPVPTTPVPTVAPSWVPAGKINIALDAELSASSSAENGSTWGLEYIIDQSDDTNGWSSDNDLGQSHEEYVQFEFSEAKISQANLFPRQDIDTLQEEDYDMLGDGFPIDFTIEVSMDGEKWTTVKTVKDAPKPTSKDPVVYTFDEVSAKYLKINATTLRIIENDRNNYRMQFFEVEIYGIR